MLLWNKLRAWWSKRTADTITYTTSPLYEEWSAEPGFHERSLRIRHNNVFFPPMRRTISEGELASAKEMDLKMLKLTEEKAELIIAFLAKFQGQTITARELHEQYKVISESMKLASGLGVRARVYLSIITVYCNVLRTELEKVLISANAGDEQAIHETLQGMEELSRIECNQAYIDVTQAKPEDRLPTLLSCSADELGFLFRVLPPKLSEVAAEWKATKSSLRAFAIQRMSESDKAYVKLLRDPEKLDLLGIVTTRNVPLKVVDVPERYVDIVILLQGATSKQAGQENNEYLISLFMQLKKEFGDQMPLLEFYNFLDSENLKLKSQMASMVEKAKSDGRTVPIEEFRKGLEAKKAELEGAERELFCRRMDETINALRAEYGEEVPIAEWLKLVQRMERATGEADSIFEL